MSETPTPDARPVADTRPGRGRRRLLWQAVVLVLVVALAAAVVWWRVRPAEGLERAVEVAPADTARLSWVDWAGFREDAGIDAGPRSGATGVQRLLDAAYTADVSATSALVASAPGLQRLLGLSPAGIAWEALAQSETGSLVVVGPGEVDLDEVADELEEAGWTRPAEDDGVWVGGVDLVTRLDPGLTPLLAHVVLLADEGLVLASDDVPYLEGVVEDLRAGDTGMEGVDGVVAAVRPDGEDPLGASVLTGDNACTDLAMAQADDEAQAEADALVEAAGDVDPLTAIATALLPGGDARVAMGFETEEQARDNADSRAALAAGPAPGQGGGFADRFTLDAASAEGETVLLDLDPVEGSAVLSDLGSGPVLYATC